MQGENDMKKRLVTILMIFGLAFSFALSACAGKEDPGTADADVEEEDDEDDDDRDNDEPDEEPLMYATTEIDYSSNKSVLKFAFGTWDMIDSTTGETYATLEIDYDGSVRYTYLPTDVTVSGSIMFKEPFDDVLDGMCAYDITLSGLEDAFGCWLDEETASGTFRIAQSSGKDYMYLEELGNGGSNIAYEVFRSPYTYEYDFDLNWILTRNNSVNYIENTEKGNVFNAFVYESAPDSVCLQRVDDVAFETYKEYTGFKYMAAYFDGRDYAEAVWYNIAPGADLSGIVSTKKFSRNNPLTVYEVTVSDGKITKMVEADRGEYGIYELYPLEQDVKCDGEKFMINDSTFYLSDYGITDTVILDYEIFGEYLILRADQNPHANTYVVFNMRTSWPEKTFSGCNFLHGDHVWDSYYTYMDTVYNYEGYPVASVEGYEISDLSFAGLNSNELVISYWKDDKYRDTVTESIDRPINYNAPIYAMADYRHHPCADTWNEFISYAPQGSQMFIMVNPPEDESWVYCMPLPVDDTYGLDYVYVVALQDNTFVNLGSSEGPILDRGNVTCYSLTVPEAGSSVTIYAETENGTSMWPVSMISGKEDIRYVFE